MSADISIHSVKKIRVVKVIQQTDLTFPSFVASIEISTEDCMGKGACVVTMFSDNLEVFNQLSQLLQEQKQQEEQEQLIAAAEL